MEKQSVTPITAELAGSLLPRRPDESHKGSFGKALVVAGSRKYTGAAGLAIRAALRSGVGLVYAAIPECIYPPLAAGIPEAIWFPLPENQGAFSAEASLDFSELVAGKNAILIGPGLGQAEGTRAFLLAVLAHIRENMADLPLVVDADALNLLAQQPDWPRLLPKKTVLTPHEMEFSRLTELSANEIHKNRLQYAAAYAQKWRQTLILKGPNTIVANSLGDCRVLPFANSVLAHGGTGDVLAGLLVGLLAQGLAPFDAATLAVWLHARAAELALEVVGNPAAVLPSDIILQLGNAMKVTAIYRMN